MTQGIKTWKADGNPMLNIDGSGGVFIGSISHSDGDPMQYVYTNLGGLSLRVVQITTNKNFWHIGTVNGYPAVIIDTYTNTTSFDYGGSLDLLVFGV